MTGHFGSHKEKPVESSKTGRVSGTTHLHDEQKYPMFSVGLRPLPTPQGAVCVAPFGLRSRFS